MALQKIGAFTTNDEAADPVELDRTLQWLDAVVARIAETRRAGWLIPTTVRFDWPAGTASDTLDNLIETVDYPPEGVLFPQQAWLIDANGVRIRELPLARRWEYEDITDKTQDGEPNLIYIDRTLAVSRAFVHPVPAVGSAALSVDLLFQKYAPSMLGPLEGSVQSGDLAHGFSQGWQLFLVTATAAEIGDGPVRRLPTGEIDAWRKGAAMMLAELEAFSNREKTSGARRTKRYGG